LNAFKLEIKRSEKTKKRYKIGHGVSKQFVDDASYILASIVETVAFPFAVLSLDIVLTTNTHP
jgi:hypothetical protein